MIYEIVIAGLILMGIYAVIQFIGEFSEFDGVTWQKQKEEWDKQDKEWKRQSDESDKTIRNISKEYNKEMNRLVRSSTRDNKGNSFFQ